MDAYIHQADLICADCEPKAQTDIIMAGLDQPNGWAKFVRSWELEDSDIFPQGPYAAGGGEADYPQCCAECQCELDNPLTTYGMETYAVAFKSGQLVY